jgi:hypothetical protein
MTNSKINHPFQVPDDFFDHLEKDLLTELDKISFQEKKKSVLFQVIKYAAIVIVAIFLGRESVKLFPGNTTSSTENETISVDLVLSQVTDEDITDFIMENATQKVLNE